MKTEADDRTILEMTTEIVGSYVLSNHLNQVDLPDLIRSVHTALASVGQPVVEAAPSTEKATNAQIRKSITPDHLISFEDGKAYMSLKRHLATRGMTPEQYREKWGLARDYPMVSPEYSARRSALAKSLGLGRKAEAQNPVPAPAVKAKAKSKKVGIDPKDDTFT